MLTVLAVILAGFFFFTIWDRFVARAPDPGHKPPWLWAPFLAALTAAGGGVLRDLLRPNSGIPTLKGEIYPEIAVVWGLSYALVLPAWQDDLALVPVVLLTVFVLLGAFLTRIAVVHFGWRSVFLGRRPPGEEAEPVRG